MDNSQLVARMRSRLEQLRRMKDVAHEPRVREVITNVAAEIEADIRRLEGTQEETAGTG
jgi:hypothetical protein